MEIMSKQFDPRARQSKVMCNIILQTDITPWLWSIISQFVASFHKPSKRLKTLRLDVILGLSLMRTFTLPKITEKMDSWERELKYEIQSIVYSFQMMHLVALHFGICLVLLHG